MLRLLVGLALLPLSASLLWSTGRAFAGVAMTSVAAAPFAAGVGLAFACWAIARWLAVGLVGAAAWPGRAARWSYVLGHELTHAMAAWASGGSVYAISVGEKEGHVDLSHSNVFVALAPYCVPFYVIAVALAYRLLLWWRPDAGGEPLFLFLMGGATGAHLLFTWDALTEVRQPDLDAAGGAVFSWALIAAVNALVMLALLKVLFPESVGFLDGLRASAGMTKRFWTFAWLSAKPLAQPVVDEARRRIR